MNMIKSNYRQAPRCGFPDIINEKTAKTKSLNMPAAYNACILNLKLKKNFFLLYKINHYRLKRCTQMVKNGFEV